MFAAALGKEFLERHWTRESWVAAIPASDFEALRRELADFDPDRLIAAHPGPVASVWFDDTDGNLQIVDMPPADAAKFHRAGLTVFLPDVTSPTIERWRNELVVALGRPPHNFLSSLFLSRRGSVSGCHFDHIENFTVQLSGTKTWRVVGNRHAPLPTVNYSARTPRPHQEELWLYAERPLPTEIDGAATTVSMAPGTVVYVPRGHWHEVEAASDSVSLLLGLPAFVWADVLLPALRTLLLRQPEWRDGAIYPRDAQTWSNARDRLAQLCRTLADTVRELDPAELLPRVDGTDGPADAFVRHPLCTLGIYDAADDALDLVASIHQGDLGRTREARVPRAWRPVLHAVDGCTRGSRGALEAGHGSEVAQVLDVLRRLEVIR